MKLAVDAGTRVWLSLPFRQNMDLDRPILFAATTDPKRSREFYEQTLGLKFVADELYAVVFRIGEIPLRIQKVNEKPRVNHTVLGWIVTDIQKTVQQLAKAGVNFLRFEGMNQDADGIWQSPGGAKVAWFKDPDENTLSLTEYP
jgi:catechol 2,3-dioxygenase-like lactoylglutathione lyase family enzyme